MISQLIDLLNLDDYYGESKTIDVAKGRYEYPSSWKATKHLLKRTWYGSRDN